MKKRVGVLAVALVILISSVAGSDGGDVRCRKMVEHILTLFETGDVAATKLLMDSAMSDIAIIECGKEESAVIKKLREAVNLAYIADRLIIAKEDALNGEGHKALRGIFAAIRAGEDMGVTIEGLDELWAVAFYGAAVENVALAKEAEQLGDHELHDALQKQAAEFITWATSLDKRIAKIIEEASKK